MGSWSLEAFIDSGDPLDVEAIARTIIAMCNTAEVLISDHLCPFDGDRLGIRVDWEAWWIIVMTRHGPDVVSDAAAISKSRAVPAEARKRLRDCNRSVRLIFGPDDARLFTSIIIDAGEYLNELSDNRTYDPQKKAFWPSEKAP